MKNNMLLFEENKGQLDAEVHHIAKRADGAFQMLSDKIAIAMIKEVDPSPQSESILENLKGFVLTLNFLGTTNGIIPQGFDPIISKHHYLKGANADSWHTDVSLFQGLRYLELWDGIDLELITANNGLKMLWHIASPADLPSLQLQWEGADHVSIQEDGSLLIEHMLGEMLDPAPTAWQIINEESIPVQCSYLLDQNGKLAFTLDGSYDPDAPLVIDPLLSYSTYLGGNLSDTAHAIAVNDLGEACVTGVTTSMYFPRTSGAFQPTLHSSTDAFISRFSADGSTLLASTFWGGSDPSTIGYSIAVDSDHNMYVGGTTSSSDLYTSPDAFQSSTDGYPHSLPSGFIVKISANGMNAPYATYLGAAGATNLNHIALDDQNCVYAAGNTTASDFPVTPGVFQPALPAPGMPTGFISKLSADGTSLVYSTLLGGTGDDDILGITLDGQYNAYVTGGTQSNDFPITPGAYETIYPGAYSAFVSKISPDATALIYSTYLGGAESATTGNAIAIDALNRAHICGLTSTTDFPTTPGVFQPVFGGTEENAFVSIFDESGSQLVASTFIGTSSYNEAKSIAVDSMGLVYITGFTTSDAFPITPNRFPSSYQGSMDCFVTVLQANLNALVVSYYWGGSNQDEAYGLAIGGPGIIYITGGTSSVDFPITPDAFQTTLDGITNAFVSRNIFQFITIRRASLSLVRLE